jgi:hypothetical protein
MMGLFLTLSFVSALGLSHSSFDVSFLPFSTRSISGHVVHHLISCLFLFIELFLCYLCHILRRSRHVTRNLKTHKLCEYPAIVQVIQERLATIDDRANSANLTPQRAHRELVDCFSEYPRKTDRSDKTDNSGPQSSPSYA